MSGQRLKSTPEWQELARRDPLYAIACWPGKQGAWSADEFYALGRSDWVDFRRHWLHYAGALGGTCVEIGCGAGRITAALAEDFDRVVGLDVSPEMIELAQRVVPDGVEFREVGGTEIPLGDGEADAVFSCHVLQHLDGLDVVSAYLGEARRVLRDGGTLMVHVPLRNVEAPLRARVREELDVWRSRRALARGKASFRARVRFYRADEFRATLTRLGFADVELRVFPVRSNGDPHPFWLARAA